MATKRVRTTSDEGVAGTTEMWKLVQTWIDAQPWGVSQRQLAAKLEVAPSLVTDWKVGRSMPQPHHIQGLAAITGISDRVLSKAVLIDAGYVTSTQDPQAI